MLVGEDGGETDHPCQVSGTETSAGAWHQLCQQCRQDLLTIHRAGLFERSAPNAHSHVPVQHGQNAIGRFNDPRTGGVDQLATIAEDLIRFSYHRRTTVRHRTRPSWSEQALNFAKIRQRQFKRKKRPTAEDTRRANELLAVIACMIRLGFCFDLLEPKNVEYFLEVFADYEESLRLAGLPLPKNDRKYRKLDCAVCEYAYHVIEESGQNASVDSARGVYVPTGGERRVWDGSWISRDTHIQLCVRNPANLLGAWLHYPTGLGVSDVCEALQAGDVGIERKDQRKR